VTNDLMQKYQMSFPPIEMLEEKIYT